jgi:3-oxo-5-alpha-steroid 4-dehydrogenase 3
MNWELYWAVHSAGMAILSVSYHQVDWLERVPPNLLSLNFLVLASRKLGCYGKVLRDSGGKGTAAAAAAAAAAERESEGLGVRVLRQIEGATVPKRWFWIFYVIGTCANSWVLAGPRWRGMKNVGLCSWLVQVQVMRRLYESLVVSRPSMSARMHVLHLILGASYYVAVPLTVAHCGGSGGYLKSAKETMEAPWWFPRTLTGRQSAWFAFAFFLFASYEQYESHRILGALRRPEKLRLATSDSADGEGKDKAYLIPRGGWFDLVSCPHYFFEVVIYASLAVLAHKRGPMLLLLLFVTIELSFSATTQHAWYRAKFRRYPKRRRAIFPYIF